MRSNRVYAKRVKAALGGSSEWRRETEASMREARGEAAMLEARGAELQPAALHLVKLCVGAPSVAALAEWVAARAARGGVAHHTRRRPTRADEILGGGRRRPGSLYWVIGGAIRCRQTILALDLETDADGTPHCAIRLSPELVSTEMRPRRPFQGWRYLSGDEAPPDAPMLAAVAGGDAADAPPPEMWAELAAVGVRLG